jgi:carbon storage regulator
VLVLSRKTNESIRIGHRGEIRVMVVEIRGDKVRIGVEAPPDIPVHRQEIFEALQADGQLPTAVAGEPVKVYVIRGRGGNRYASLDPGPWPGEEVLGEGVVYIKSKAKESA